MSEISRGKPRGLLPLLAVVTLLFFASGVQAAIEGISGPSFNFTAKAGHISTPDGDSLLFWGYANGAGTVQYPGPTMIVTQGQAVSVTLTNELGMPVSMVFPGQDVTASGGTPGLLTREAPPGGLTSVTYSFTPANPGTYLYHSGTRPDLQVEMGLVGALIVRPSNFFAGIPTAYGNGRSTYDYEYLFLLTEMDPNIHNLVEDGRMAEVDNAGYYPVLWFINGRNAPDTMAPSLSQGGTLLPTQPYNCMPLMQPGKRMLLRMIGAGRDSHPFHTHGNNFDLIARDGKLLESIEGASRQAEIGIVPDLAVSDFTQQVEPGGTFDAIFTWTGKGLGWDFYGHTDSSPGTLAPGECPNGVLDPDCDHGKPFPVALPENKDMTFGGFYSGSPFMGAEGTLPPGEGGNNPSAGFAFMWHTHNEKEMTNNDIFPGGLMTMMIVVPPWVTVNE